MNAKSLQEMTAEFETAAQRAGLERLAVGSELDDPTGPAARLIERALDDIISREMADLKASQGARAEALADRLAALESRLDDAISRTLEPLREEMGGRFEALSQTLGREITQVVEELEQRERVGREIADEDIARRFDALSQSHEELREQVAQSARRRGLGALGLALWTLSVILAVVAGAYADDALRLLLT